MPAGSEHPTTVPLLLPALFCFPLPFPPGPSDAVLQPSARLAGTFVFFSVTVYQTAYINFYQLFWRLWASHYRKQTQKSRRTQIASSCFYLLQHFRPMVPTCILLPYSFSSSFSFSSSSRFTCTLPERRTFTCFTG